MTPRGKKVEVGVEVEAKVDVDVPAVSVPQVAVPEVADDCSHPTLRRHDRNDHVRVLQRHLRVMEDGVFGVTTERAVRALQVEAEVKVTGVADAHVWHYLGVK